MLPRLSPTSSDMTSQAVKRALQDIAERTTEPALVKCRQLPVTDTALPLDTASQPGSPSRRVPLQHLTPPAETLVSGSQEPAASTAPAAVPSGPILSRLRLDKYARFDLPEPALEPHERRRLQVWARAFLGRDDISSSSGRLLAG